MEVAVRSHAFGWWAASLAGVPAAMAAGAMVLIEPVNDWVVLALAAVVGATALAALGRHWRLRTATIATGIVAAAAVFVPWWFVVFFAWATYACNYTDQCPFS